ncbi:MAG: citrate transporter [Lamprocystis purpurea]|jgi:Na+/H+ antiporter NhaD/arsenite permease-like protein|uniref:SLC13 family permease n=1 Tax=Lamprocystis purpurea TaxID=61598 RepID=UPI00036AACE6|nr:SLC13 family permease [Lamprocystis purpurea]MBV5273110.1 citrate transporter [Lamprocystis purpurea]
MSIVLIIFVVVYLGMMLGHLPWLKVDRAAIALGGAIALLAAAELTEAQAVASVDFGTIGMLFGLMLLSIQFELSGLYGAVSARVGAVQTRPAILLALLIGLVGVMSALLTNDVVAVAMTPVVLSICLRRGLNPVPFLLAIAFAANAGSVATLIGSPQNMLIGERLQLSFVHYMAYAAVPALLSLGVVWLALMLFYRAHWQLQRPDAADRSAHSADAAAPPFDRWETIKGLLVLGFVLYAFIFTEWSRGLVAASAGAFMLFNARFMSRSMLHRMDWGLLILFVGLFIVNGAFQNTGMPQQLVGDLNAAGFNLQHSDVLFVLSAVLSDITSNVPTVMLLLPYANDPEAGPLMALASGLSSNLIVIGSLANIIVVDAANARGLNISFREFAKVGLPVALSTLLIAWVWVRYLM